MGLHRDELPKQLPYVIIYNNYYKPHIFSCPQFKEIVLYCCRKDKNVISLSRSSPDKVCQDVYTHLIVLLCLFGRKHFKTYYVNFSQLFKNNIRTKMLHNRKKCKLSELWKILYHEYSTSVIYIKPLIITFEKVINAESFLIIFIKLVGFTRKRCCQVIAAERTRMLQKGLTLQNVFI